MHAVNDAMFAGVYPLLPLVAADLHLTYADVGAVKALLGASSAVLQVPAGMLAEVVGEHILLVVGTASVGLGLMGMALASSFLALLMMAVATGIGGNTQHPVANAAVAHVYDDESRPRAIGTLNFAGDVGKVVAPFVAGLGAAAGWRGGLTALGAFGAVFAAAYAIIVPVRWASVRARPATLGPLAPSATRSRTQSDSATTSQWDRAWGVALPSPYTALAGIGAIDAAARGAALALLPFAFSQAGMDAAEIGFAFAVMFGAGAAGKLLCGPLASRFGPVFTIIATEVVTAAGIVIIPFVPREVIPWAVLPFGFSLNGTSSILYALVAPLAVPEQRARAYGLFYTVTLLATAGAPLAYGYVADILGLTNAFAILGAITLVVVPLTWRWHRAIQIASA